MKKAIIIGGGAAGMQTALRLAERGIEPLILEKEAEPGGKLRGWHALFPTFTPAEEILTELRQRIEAQRIRLRPRAEVRSLTPKSVTLADGQRLECDAV
ncbi:MAG: FAD-dependent oxidoreductase, partial [Alistipes sp.]|nr:FAD-dependent oxidoreductase [Alistipes sp.]